MTGTLSRPVALAPHEPLVPVVDWWLYHRVTVLIRGRGGWYDCGEMTITEYDTPKSVRREAAEDFGVPVKDVRLRSKEPRSC